MKKKTLPWLAILLVPTAALCFKAQQPTPTEAARIIRMAESRKVADGASTKEVLRYAEKLRPKIFKLAGDFDFGYDSEGRLSTVGVCYWIGSKRSKDDAYCDISWDISKDRKLISPSTGSLNGEAAASLTVMRLEAGRDAFLQNIDMFYESTCINPSTQRRYC
jgi:hypothetical protein